MNRVRAGKLIFRDPVLLCGMVYLLLYFDASGFLRLGLLAAVLHELGHILVYCIQQRHLPVIEVTMTGFLYAHGRGEAFSAPAACRWPSPGLRSILPLPGYGRCVLRKLLPSAAARSGRQICSRGCSTFCQSRRWMVHRWRRMQGRSGGKNTESAHNPPETIAKPAHLG